MLSKSKAIVLHAIKYSESSVIAYCYTQHFGKISFLVQGVRKKNAHIKFNQLQPLQVNDIDFYYKEKHGLMRIKDLRSCHIADELLFETQKSTIALFLSEILYKTLKEEIKNNDQFLFIENNIAMLNNLENGFVAFYIKFLVDYSLYLGFYPNTDDQANSGFFDLRNGIFLKNQPAHEFYISGELLKIFEAFLNSDERQIYQQKISNIMRNNLLNTILDYYMLHMDGFTNLQSLNVLRDLFHG